MHGQGTTRPMSDLLTSSGHGNNDFSIYLYRLNDILCLQEGDLLEVIRTGKPGESDGSGTVTLRKNDFRSSTKLDALLQNLRRAFTALLSHLWLTFDYRCHPVDRPSIPSSRLFPVHHVPRPDSARARSRTVEMVQVRRYDGREEAERSYIRIQGKLR